MTLNELKAEIEAMIQQAGSGDIGIMAWTPDGHLADLVLNAKLGKFGKDPKFYCLDVFAKD
jgi:hypothetical protein